MFWCGVSQKNNNKNTKICQISAKFLQNLECFSLTTKYETPKLSSFQQITTVISDTMFVSARDIFGQKGAPWVASEPLQMVSLTKKRRLSCLHVHRRFTRVCCFHYFPCSARVHSCFGTGHLRKENKKTKICQNLVFVAEKD